jgi:putative methyltransferase (TIGR04325 family)
MQIMPIALADVVPPIFMRLVRRSTPIPEPHIFGDYPSWEAALADAVPFEADFNVDGSVTEQIRRGERRSGTNFVPILCGILLGGGKVLDYGGNFGFMYFQAMRAIPSRIEWWRVVDLLKVVEYGNAHFADGTLAFFDSTEKALAGERPDIVLCSGVLQYLADPYSTLRNLLATEVKTLVLNEVPVADKERFALQWAHQTIGDFTRAIQILCEAKLGEATADYEIVSEADLRAWAPFPGVRQLSRVYRRKQEQTITGLGVGVTPQLET